MGVPSEVGLIIEDRSSLPQGQSHGVWVVLERYDPDEDGPIYRQYPYSKAITLVEGLPEDRATTLAEKLAEMFQQLGSKPLISTADDV